MNMKSRMQYRLLATLSFVLASISTVSARDLTSDEALARAVTQHNISRSHRSPMSASAFHLVEVGQNARQQTAYYVFDREQGGFLVAAADDTEPAILALIDDGQYTADALPEGFKVWLREMSDHGAAPLPAKRLATSVAPLLADDQIAWGQQTPYNAECPKFNYQGYYYDTLAGCAAIAIGQIMRYHRHPSHGAGSADYSSYVSVQGTDIVTHVERDFSAHTYDWTKIRGNYLYTGYGTTDERAEVAKFVADVACALKMNFDPTASATTDLCVAQALTAHFDYDRSLQLVDHSFYSTAEWADLLRAELDAGRPVYLSGANVTNTANGDMLSGHAFVVDGYNADGLFHINWGWEGKSDGYYALTALNPTSQGSGGSAGGYSFMSNAIIGIQPNYGGEASKALLSMTGEYWETSYDSENDGYIVRANIANVSAVDFEGFVAMRIVEGDEIIFPAKNMAWKLGCKAGASGSLGKGINKDYFLAHPTARIEMVYAHKDGVLDATDAERTAMLESVADDEWILMASREGTPRSLQAFLDAQGNLTFGNKDNEVFQLRFAGLDADITPAAGRTVKFTAKVTNESDYEYFAPLYLFIYDAAGEWIDYSTYDLHLLPPHTTRKYDFNVTLPSGYSSFRYAVAYEDKGYDWSYVPMPLSMGDGVTTASLFDDGVPVTSDTSADSSGTSDGTIAAVGDVVEDLPDVTPTEGYAYCLRNADNGYYLSVVPSETKSTLLSSVPEALYFTKSGSGYTIQDADGNYIGKYDTATGSNSWNISSTVAEIWTLVEVSPGKYALKSASSGYLGFDETDTNVTPYRQFSTNPEGMAAFRNKDYTRNHGLFTIEAAYIRYDVDGSRSLDTADVRALRDILLGKGRVTPPADVDGNRYITISDLIAVIKRLNN